jgi:hypothetical protein
LNVESRRRLRSTRRRPHREQRRDGTRREAGCRRSPTAARHLRHPRRSTPRRATTERGDHTELIPGLRPSLRPGPSYLRDHLQLLGAVPVRERRRAWENRCARRDVDVASPSGVWHRRPRVHSTLLPRAHGRRVSCHRTAAWCSGCRGQLRSHRPPGRTASRDRALECTGGSWRTSHPRGVEDEVPIRYTVADVLRSRGYEIDTASSGVTGDRDGRSPAHPVERGQA